MMYGKVRAGLKNVTLREGCSTIYLFGQNMASSGFIHNNVHRSYFCSSALCMCWKWNHHLTRQPTHLTSLEQWQVDLKAA